MLPFMAKRNQSAGLIVTTRSPDEGKEPDASSDHEMEACANDLIKAVHAQDIKAAAEAIKAAFAILESRPHEEASMAEEGSE